MSTDAERCYVCMEECDTPSPCLCKELRIHKSCMADMVSASGSVNCGVCTSPLGGVALVAVRTRARTCRGVLVIALLFTGTVASVTMSIAVFSANVQGSGPRSLFFAMSALGFISTLDKAYASLGEEGTVYRTRTGTRGGDGLAPNGVELLKQGPEGTILSFVKVRQRRLEFDRPRARQALPPHTEGSPTLGRRGTAPSWSGGCGRV